MLKGLPEGAFPPLELEWLAAAAWNRGCHHERFGREAAAKDFVRATRELLRHSDVKSGRLLVRFRVLPAAFMLLLCGLPQRLQKTLKGSSAGAVAEREGGGAPEERRPQWTGGHRDVEW